MSLENIFTLSDENEIFGRDISLTYTANNLPDIEIDESGDLKLTNGLAELVASQVTMMLITIYDYMSGQGELPYHPEFGSALLTLLMTIEPSEEQIEMLKNEIFLSIFTHFPDLVEAVEFPYIEFDNVNRTLKIYITIYTVTGSQSMIVVG